MVLIAVPDNCCWAGEFKQNIVKAGTNQSGKSAGRRGVKDVVIEMGGKETLRHQLSYSFKYTSFHFRVNDRLSGNILLAHPRPDEHGEELRPC